MGEDKEASGTRARNWCCARVAMRGTESRAIRISAAHSLIVAAATAPPSTASIAAAASAASLSAAATSRAAAVTRSAICNASLTMLGPRSGERL